MEVTAMRRVRQVRLRAENAAAAQRGLVLLEDALHTAALPGAAGRLLIVRRLEVGVIDPQAGPNRVALAVEARLRDLALHAVAADAPEGEQAAAGAPAVTFRDALAPCVALALRLARGLPADAWYWPLAVAGWRADLPRAEGLRRAVLRAAAILPGGAGARRVAVALARTGLAGALLAALEPGDAVRLLELHGVPPALFVSRLPAPHPPAAQGFSAGGLPDAAAPGGLALPQHWRVALAQAVRLSTQDARLWWLALAALGEAAPALLLAPPAAARAAQQAIAALTTGTEIAPHAHHRRDAALPSSIPPNRQSITDIPGQETGRAARAAPEKPPQEEQFDGVATAGGGLLFAVPLLHALGFAPWLAQRPALAAARLPERLLLLLARHARLPPEDPLVAWLAGEVAQGAQDGSLVAQAEDACRLWRAGLRGWLARRARLTLRALILRPALAAITPTHVDLTFDLASADLRIRRLGLDVDPGWVAWLGRVVTFHYADRVIG